VLADLFTTNLTDDAHDDGEIVATSCEAYRVCRERRGRYVWTFYWLALPPHWHAAQQYSTKPNDLSTSRPTSEAIADSIDLGWREPEKVKKGKKKGTAIDATDSTDAKERSEAAKVRLPSALF
jgi:hypothetical protein